ncbi:MAG: hypothetical protein Kow0037_32210 [Calditrichia bacterium]
MRNIYLISTLFALFLYLSGCGPSKLEEANQAMKSGKYAQALKLYLELQKEQPENSDLKGKIALAYFKHGEEIYQQRKVLSAFEYRVEAGLKYLPEDLPDSSRQMVSEVFHSLAKAYENAPPENEIQKKEFFKKALNYYEESLRYNPDNQAAKADFSMFKTSHFQEMLNRGKNYLKRGKSDPLNYLTAEYYLEKAAQFDPENSEAQKLLKEARKAGLNVLDISQNVPLAVTDQIKKSDFQAFFIVVQNLSDSKIEIKPENFIFISADGKEFPGEISEKVGNPLPRKTLNPEEEASGVVALTVTPQPKISRIEYRPEGQPLGYKNLP